MDDAGRANIAAALDRLEQEGCPLATSPHDATIEAGLRRWNSFALRNRIRRPTREDRITDLARSLYERLQPKEYRAHGDPLMRDAECVARAIADVLDPPPLHR